ncbi:hypothetical protein KOR34_16950 [Posidoniimonas corsicana]|uniref:Phage metallopeptidase domain-containing protein n=1 Tax=Posidoniimonas corsicana TaxID=1938618 RepID=A0A5C5VGC6_9BACT|nr:hypothetical protein [Posidoniimonas corsicana]TWT36755.1 hypothetical protein KOR34_16950 [Posidoniimonas corsicana]
MPLDLTNAVRLLTRDMTKRVAELAHIDTERVAFGFCQTRKAVSHGVQASLTPLRFEGGAKTKRMRGRLYGCQRLEDGSGRDYLYLLNLYVPRLLDQPFEEKLTTIVHELWHISPAFDGDLRRHEGRCYVHGRSQREFDELSASIARAWLAQDPPRGLYSFLEHSFRELSDLHNGVRGQRFPTPKLVLADAA